MHGCTGPPSASQFPQRGSPATLPAKNPNPSLAWPGPRPAIPCSQSANLQKLSGTYPTTTVQPDFSSELNCRLSALGFLATDLLDQDIYCSRGCGRIVRQRPRTWTRRNAVGQGQGRRFRTEGQGDYARSHVPIWVCFARESSPRVGPMMIVMLTTECVL